jgi:hypothetical protein
MMSNSLPGCRSSHPPSLVVLGILLAGLILAAPPSIDAAQGGGMQARDNAPAWQKLPRGVPYAAPTDPVRIVSVVLSSYDVHAGDAVFARVVTTSNAAALTAQVGTYRIRVPRVAPGIFETSLNVPRVVVPHHKVAILLTAIRADGATAHRTVSVNVYYF